MLQRILTCALFAGLATGVLMTALHAALTVPLIQYAEIYEQRANAETAATHSHDHGHAHGHEHASGHTHAESWTPEGWQRIAFTFLSTIICTVGFALMLNAAAIAAYGDISLWTGLGVGLAGFAATGLATSLGLAPELPGSAAADLVMRQGWWIATAAATAAGLALIVLSGRPIFRILGLVLIIGPHVVGAQVLGTASSPVPAELSALFAARSLVLQGVMWALLGLFSGWIWQRQSRGLGDPIAT
jgi:cobalt transporter subunit CbtA